MVLRVAFEIRDGDFFDRSFIDFSRAYKFSGDELTKPRRRKGIVFVEIGGHRSNAAMQFVEHQYIPKRGKLHSQSRFTILSLC